MPAWSRQYRNVVFTHDEEQARLARASAAALAKDKKIEVKTAIEPYTGFTLAEDYHQKYTLRHVAPFLLACGGWDDDLDGLLVDSTACARLNGYLSGHGSATQLEEELPSLGLTPKLADLLRSEVAAAAGPDDVRGCR